MYLPFISFWFLYFYLIYLPCFSFRFTSLYFISLLFISLFSFHVTSLHFASFHFAFMCMLFLSHGPATMIMWGCEMVCDSDVAARSQDPCQSDWKGGKLPWMLEREVTRWRSSTTAMGDTAQWQHPGTSDCVTCQCEASAVWSCQSLEVLLEQTSVNVHGPDFGRPAGRLTLCLQDGSTRDAYLTQGLVSDGVGYADAS